MAFIDITGNVYGQLTVLRETLPRKIPTTWVCLCSCGKTKEVIGASMKNGSTKSCGCLHIITNKKQFTKHGDCLDSLYQVHQAMLQRCSNPKHKVFKHYGLRGIVVCTEWHDYLAFKNWAISHGYAKGLTLERANTDLGYNPDNCIWADMEQQTRNRRAMAGHSSKYIGVSWDTSREKWVACIGVKNKTIPLGRFDSEIDAAQARDNYIIENNLKYFVLNFT